MESEATIRFISFLAVAIALVVWELVSPRRGMEQGRTRRWIGNLGVVAISAFLIRLLFPVLPVALAVTARQKGWGLMPLFDLP